MATNRNLRLLVIGQFISAIGDQFYLIALPLLALQLADSAFVAGTLLGVASVPRTVFMLLGGAVTDRYSAKTLLLVSNSLQVVVMAGLTLAMMSSFTRFWFLYSIAFLTGFIDAFSLPAFNTMLPQIVDEDELERGNIYLQGANMASGVLGPVLAGLSIAAVASMGSESNLTGLATAFAVNAVTYGIGILFFWRIDPHDGPRAADEVDKSFARSLRVLFEFVGRDLQLRNLFGLMLVLGLFLAGTIRVGFLLLANTQFSNSAQNFGYMNSAFGAGLLAGMVAVRLLPHPPESVSGGVTLLLFSCVPIGLILLGLTPSIQATLAIILLMGAALGYVTIYLLSWLQRRTPAHLLGRMMALVLFATFGLSPLSQILMGFLFDLNLQATFQGVGSVVLLLLVFTGMNRAMWRLRQ